MPVMPGETARKCGPEMRPGNAARRMVTDDGVRSALEYNCVRWGSHDLPPQAGLGVYERGPYGLLAAARVCDDVDATVR
jgi:hypothetical protein